MNFQLHTARANLVFLLLWTYALAHDRSDVTKSTNELKRQRNVERKNLRLSQKEGSVQVNEDVEMVKKQTFEEDEELWERILKQELSLPPATFPPVPVPGTLMPTALPIMTVDEECELMVSYVKYV